ncbi:hypothetical protein UCRNP2_2625 [Neofusicoccum parvum UCRNP2]|uniref:Uncharacterized protein n=1 Tax=Botryosphaeria parva (strain UCR-NP2) TaxID=1287680 RepID=R1GQS6_BOTPV|nr:hypothetical protein UCRNP2_2625 [Neofusicoccum parvum UCRNP2]
MCLFKTAYDPYHEPPPRTGTHTAYYHTRPASHHSHHSVHHYRHSGSVARLPPPARRSHDHHHHHYRSSASSLPVSERRYVEVHEPARRSLVVERQPSPGGWDTVRREKVVYRT